MKANHLLRSTALAVLLLTVLSVRAGTITHSESFPASNWSSATTTYDGTTYVQYSYAGLNMVGPSAHPSLPCRTVKFSVPYNATNFAVTITSESHSDGNDTLTYYPVPQPMYVDDDNGLVLLCDSAVYSTNALYPSSPAAIVGDGFYMGENHVITVALYPMRVNPVTHTHRQYSQLSITLSYDLTSGATSAVSRVASCRWRDIDKETVKSMVVNPAEVASNMTPAYVEPIEPISLNHLGDPTPLNSVIDSIDPGSGNWPVNEVEFWWPREYYEYTIITTRDQAEAYKRLAAWKRQKGYTAGVVCVEDIVNFFENNNISLPLVVPTDPITSFTEIADSAGMIRSYLRLAFRNGARYVLMGGEDVPFRYGYHYVGGPGTDDDIAPTDLYYRDLNTNWNKDGDSLYGECLLYDDGQVYNDSTNYGFFDLSPELYVGRLFSRTRFDVYNFTDKVIRYETLNGVDSLSYVKNLFNFSSGDIRSHTVNMMNFMADTLGFSVTDTIAPTTGAHLLYQINAKQYGFLSMHCHGASFGFYASGGGYENNSYLLEAFDSQYRPDLQYRDTISYNDETGNGLDGMLNKQYPSILFTSSCSVAAYDSYQRDSVLNVAYSFTCGDGYGGPVFIGSSNDGLTDNMWSFINSFNSELFKQRYKLGITLAEAIGSREKRRNDCDLWMNMIMNLIGDPELELWTDTPSSIQQPFIFRQKGGIMVGGLPSNGDYFVSYCDNQGNAGLVSCQNGYAMLTGLSPNSTIMIYRHNCMPYIAPLLLQNATMQSQHVLASSVEIGNEVDENRKSGDVTISAGTDFKIEYTERVRLDSGFKVERGATFSARPLFLNELHSSQ